MGVPPSIGSGFPSLSLLIFSKALMKLVGTWIPIIGARTGSQTLVTWIGGVAEATLEAIGVRR